MMPAFTIKRWATRAMLQSLHILVTLMLLVTTAMAQCPAPTVTGAYHSLFGITFQTDANNQTIYTEYDEFDRMMNTLDDKNKNIIKANAYDFKK
jgi:hypothetical protein